MRVLVTGFAGYIGPVVVKRLKEEGHEVIGLDTGWFLSSYAGLPEWPDVVSFRDIRAPFPLPAADAVVHLAGLSNDPLGDLDPDLTDRINYRATTDLIFAYRNARHIVISSCAVYGGTGTIATEETVPHPLTPYARAKADVDIAMHGGFGSGYNAVSLRLGTVFGYSPGHRLDLVVNRMCYDAINEGIVTVRGNARRPLVHIDDVASAVAFMLERPEKGVYNVVGDNVRIGDLGRYISNFAGVDLQVTDPDADQRDYMAVATKLTGLGWAPTRTVEGSLPVLFERTINLPPGQYERLPALCRLIDSGRLNASLRSTQRTAA